MTIYDCQEGGKIKLLQAYADPCVSFKYFLASGDFCRLLITFANSLYTDQDQQNVGPDLDTNYLIL